ncbi:MAG: hypothetical protein ACM3ZQ_03295 [Bacillota bacterium]
MRALWIATLPFLAASLLFATQRKWYWTVFMLCFAAYNLGTRLSRLSASGIMVRGLLIVPWGVLTIMEIIARRWLGVVAYGCILIWQIVDKRTRQQRVA